MKAGQVIEQDVPVQISLNIAKVDKATREVEGVCTQEVTDVHGEIVDHESMKAALLAWPGNIREMHQPIAVGKAVSVVSDDEAKATILRSRVSKGAPDTWEKVLDGTLCMYSIGGSGKKVVTKKADGTEEKRIYIKNLSEVSLVDNGACPTAKFQIVKSVDGQAIECQPEEPAEELAQKRAPVVGAMRDVLARVLPELTKSAMPKALAAHEVASTAVAKLETAVSTDPAAIETIEKRSYPSVYTINRTLGAIALLEEILAEEWWKARDADAADEDATTDKAQLQVLRNAIELVIAYLLSEFNAQFADLDAEASATSIMNAAIGRRAELVEKAAFELPVVFSKIDGTGQMWFAKAGARHSKADSQMIQAMHDTAVTLGAMDCAACAKAATEKAVGTQVTDTDTQKTATPAPATPQETSAASADAQPSPAPAAAPAPAVATETPIQHAAGLTEAAVQTLVKTAVDQALQAHQATSDATIAELTKRVEQLSSEPAPGGPKARATGTEGTPVHKTIGNGAADLENADPTTVVAFAQELAKDATPQERERIAQNLLRFQFATGAGAVLVKQSQARQTPQA